MVKKNEISESSDYMVYTLLKLKTWLGKATLANGQWIKIQTRIQGQAAAAVKNKTVELPEVFDVNVKELSRFTINACRKWISDAK